MSHTFNVRQSVVALINADTEAEAIDFLRHRIERAAEMLGHDWRPPSDAPLFTLFDDVGLNTSNAFHSETCDCGR